VNDASQSLDKNVAQNQKNTYTQPTNSQTQNNKPDSTTKVHFSGEGVPDYVSGVRKSTGVRIDTGVYTRFKPLSKRLFGSTCKAVETFMIGVVEVAEKGVHFSNTEQRINMEKIVIERNLSKERRNFRVVSDDVKLQSVDVGKCVVCGRDAYARGIDAEGSRFLCRADFQKVKPHLLGWKVLE
jgi:hypothetical protein